MATPWACTGVSGGLKFVCILQGCQREVKMHLDSATQNAKNTLMKGVSIKGTHHFQDFFDENK